MSLARRRQRAICSKRSLRSLIWLGMASVPDVVLYDSPILASMRRKTYNSAMLGAKGLAETSREDAPLGRRCRQLLGEFMMSGRLLGRAALAQAFRTALRSVTIGGLQFFRCN